MEWDLSDRLRKTYTEWFTLRSRGRDSVTVCSFADMVRDMKLKESKFLKIWELCAGASVDRLNYPMFVVASFFADKCTRGIRVPLQLPESCKRMLLELKLPFCAAEALPEEFAELACADGIKSETAVEVLGYIHSDFSPIKSTIGRVVGILSLYVPHRVLLCEVIAADFLLDLISRPKFSEEVKMHAAVCLCSLSACNALWMLDFVNLAILIVCVSLRNDISHGSVSVVLSAVANSCSSATVFDRVCSSEAPTGQESYVTQLIHLVSIPTLSEEVLRLFFNGNQNNTALRDLLCEVFKTPNVLGLLTLDGCQFLCALLTRSWKLSKANQDFIVLQLHIVANLHTRLNQSLFSEEGSANGLVGLITCMLSDRFDLHAEFVAQGGLDFVTDLYTRCPVSGVYRILQLILQQNNTHAQECFKLIYTICKHDRECEETLGALDCWLTWLVLTPKSLDNKFLEFFLRGGNLPIIEKVVLIIAKFKYVDFLNDLLPIGDLYCIMSTACRCGFEKCLFESTISDSTQIEKLAQLAQILKFPRVFAKCVLADFALNEDNLDHVIHLLGKSDFEIAHQALLQIISNFPKSAKFLTVEILENLRLGKYFLCVLNCVVREFSHHVSCMQWMDLVFANLHSVVDSKKVCLSIIWRLRKEATWIHEILIPTRIDLLHERMCDVVGNIFLFTSMKGYYERNLVCNVVGLGENLIGWIVQTGSHLLCNRLAMALILLETNFRFKLLLYKTDEFDKMLKKSLSIIGSCTAQTSEIKSLHISLIILSKFGETGAIIYEQIYSMYTSYTIPNYPIELHCECLLILNQNVAKIANRKSGLNKIWKWALGVKNREILIAAIALMDSVSQIVSLPNMVVEMDKIRSTL